MLWLLPLLPALTGPALWLAAPLRATGGSRVARRRLGAGAAACLGGTLGLALWAAAAEATATLDWGAGLSLELATTPVAAVVAVLVPVIALPIVAYAAAHEEADGLARLVGLLVAFVGAMELLVVAADFLSLLIGWELVGALSWALIGHQYRDADKPAAAAHAFNATRLGDLGLFLAAMATFSATGSLAYDELGADMGGLLGVAAAGIVLAATAKSGQALFSPWLFSAMAGPTPVSALLHAATMVAAGAYLLIRLHAPLAGVSWFGPLVIAIGLVTALCGGLVAALQSHAKKLLAASTSAQYGLMFVAVGAGFPAVALAHLVAHAFLKGLLFLTAGVAISATGSGQLGRMRLGSALRATAGLAAVGSLALAAVPPLGAAWTKEEVAAAAGHAAPWLAVAVALAGGLSALYATRFHLLAYGPPGGGDEGPRALVHRPGRTELAAMGALAAGSVALGALWWPTVGEAAARTVGSELPSGKPWEVAVSLGFVGVAVYGAWAADRNGRLGSFALAGAPRAASDWLGLPALVRRGLVDPVLAVAAALARFDDRVLHAGVDGAGRSVLRLSDTLATRDLQVVDSGPRGLAGLAVATARLLASVVERGMDAVVAVVAALVGSAASDARRLQTGLVQHSYIWIVGGIAAAVVVASLWR